MMDSTYIIDQRMQPQPSHLQTVTLQLPMMASSSHQHQQQQQQQSLPHGAVQHAVVHTIHTSHLVPTHGAMVTNHPPEPAAAPLIELAPKPSTSKAKSSSPENKGKGRRSRNPDNWLANVRKRKRQRGEDYIDRTGQMHRARRVGAGCGTTCRLRCEKLLSPEDRQRVHDQFWSLDDQQKWHFYAIYVERWNKARQRGSKKNKNEESGEGEDGSEEPKPRKKYSYVYFLQNKHGGRVRVCKTFFLSTLDINQKRLYFFYENVRTESGLPRAPLRGKVGSRATPDVQIQQVRDHIRAFSRLPPPPGLTPQPGEEFLDAGISVRRMYELYREAYGSMSVKENVYRKVLKQDFNIKFIKPPTSAAPAP